jgi:hypothetical protein
LGERALFQTLQEGFRQQFRTLADELARGLRETIAEHFAVVQGTLDMVRDENIALEAESDPRFRSRVDAAWTETSQEMEQIRARLGI